MAQSFLTPINMNKLEITNLRLQNLASAPGSPVSGQIYYDTGTSKAYFYNGSSFVAMDGSAGGGVLATDYSSAHTILRATSANTPTALIVAADTLVGRATGVDSGNITDLTVAEVKALLNLEDADVKALAGAMVTGNTETGITVTYQAGDNTIDFVVSTLDALPAPTASLSLNSQKITNLATPTVSTDAATKAYVDATAAGIDVKGSVRVASTATVGTYNSTGGTSALGQLTSAPNTLDGVTLAANDRILVKDHSTGAANGIYVVTTLGSGANGVWDRAGDADSDAEVTSGMYVFVEEGTANADAGFILTTNNPITLGGASGTSLTFTQFSGAGQITAGAGLTKTGNTIDVIGTSNRITVNANDIDISAAYVGQTSITTLGTITTGTWTGTAIAAANGGTGQTSYAVGDILYASTSSALSKLAGVATGNALISGGIATAPSWGKIGLTTHVSGTLGVTNGGTGIATVATGDLLQATASNTISALSSVATGNVLISGGIGTASSWGKVGLTTHVSGTLAVGSGGTGLTTVATNGILYGAGTGNMVATAAGTQYQVFQAGASGVPVFGAVNLAQAAAVTGALGAANGGSGQTTYAVGDILQASASTTLSKLAAVATGNVLISGGVTTVSSWGKVGLTTHVSGTLPIANGGTGQTTAAAALTALGGTTKYSTSIGDNSTTAIVVTHSLGTRDVQIQVYDNTTWDTVYPDVARTSTTTATITFAVAPTTNQYRVVVIG
jgi:hypothetical protein